MTKEIDWSKVKVREITSPTLIKTGRRKDEPFAFVHLHQAAKVAAVLTSAQQLFVWLWLVQQTRRTKSHTVTVSNEVLQQYGIYRYVKRRALLKLEMVGLITVERRQGKAPRVRLFKR
jgi:hypothetical protein